MGNKVLLADDSITIQKLVEMAFSDTNLELVAVSDGKQAVDKIDEVKPDIILADAIMPLLDGYQVCEWVKSQPEYAHIPVVLLTGRFQPFDQARAEAVKIDERVVKPFVQEQLVELIHRLISGEPVEDLEPPAPDTEAPLEAEEAPIPPEPVDEGEKDTIQEEDALFLEDDVDDSETIVEEATRADMEKIDFDNETIRVNPDELKAYLNDMRVPGVADQLPQALPEAENLEENEFDDSFNRSIESLELDEFEELRGEKIPEEAGQDEEIMNLEDAELLDEEPTEPEVEISQEKPEEEVVEEEVAAQEETEDAVVVEAHAEEEGSAIEADETLDEVEEIEAPSIDEIDTVSVEEEEAEAVKPDPDEDLTAPFPQIDVDTNVVFERQDVPDKPEKKDLDGLDELEFEEESFTEEPITEPSEEETAPDIEQPSELDVALHAEPGIDDTGEIEDSEPITEPTEREPLALEEAEDVLEEGDLIEELDDADLIPDDEEMTQEQEVPTIDELDAMPEEKAEDLAISEELLLGESLADQDEAEELDLSDPALLDVEDSAPFELSEEDLIEEPPLEPQEEDLVFEAPVPAEALEEEALESLPEQPEPIEPVEPDSEAPTEDLSDVEFVEEFEESSPKPAVEEQLMEEIQFDLQEEGKPAEEVPPVEEEFPEAEAISEEPIEELDIEPIADLAVPEEDLEVEPELEEMIDQAPELEEESLEAEDVELDEETQPIPEVQPAEPVEAAPISSGASRESVILEPEQLDYLVDQVVEKVMARLGDTVGNIAWEVIPELSEAMIKKRIFELETSADSE